MLIQLKAKEASHNRIIHEEYNNAAAGLCHFFLSLRSGIVCLFRTRSKPGPCPIGQWKAIMRGANKQVKDANPVRRQGGGYSAGQGPELPPIIALKVMGGFINGCQHGRLSRNTPASEFTLRFAATFSPADGNIPDKQPIAERVNVHWLAGGHCRTLDPAPARMIWNLLAPALTVYTAACR
ncbi:hypothetical protein JZ751_014733 [Albula glossodonta]|uniref:Uncharacterized protein n=1 Tax=Albula glossodonta TaxID=121402 RepID=A0A8T2MWY2_9TELE|nr:hypothetical protein JZ751_014733 [Albula glossodonta]